MNPDALSKDSKVFVAGHRGLVGSAVKRQLNKAGFGNLVTRSHGELDLTRQSGVESFFASERPEAVVLCAAKVGGIMANSTYPAQFIQVNLAIQTNVIHAAWRHGARRLIFMGSSCIYPRECPQPIKEEHLLSGPLEITNRPYALAKIAGVEMCWSYYRQYGAGFMAVMPTNVYGPGDNYDLETSHVLPALIHRFHLAKLDKKPQVTLWGTGRPWREFIYSEDLGQACAHLMSMSDAELTPAVFSQDHPPLINIGSQQELTISDLAQLVAEVVGYEGELAWDPDKPDGTYRKRLDTSLLDSLGWKARTPLKEGIALAYEDFLNTHGT